MQPTTEQSGAAFFPLTELLAQILRQATHEVLFDPKGPRHVMAVDMKDYRRIMKLLEEQPV